MTSGTSSDLLAHFGKQLRRLRLEAGLTQEGLGSQVGYSAALVGMVETGRRVPSYQFASSTDRVLDARGVLEGLWLPIHERCRPDQRFEAFAELETRAIAIDTYEAHIVPGLLQTEPYIRAIVANTRPRVSGGETESRVAARMARREALTKANPPRYWAIVGETALHQRHGDRTIMRDQLQHLIDQTESHTITLQVLPFNAPDPAWGMSFSVFTFDPEPPMVYLDTFPMGIYHNPRADVVIRCQSMFNYLREAALSEPRSVDLITDLVKELC